MSYPDKEKRTDYLLDSVEASTEKLNKKQEETSPEDEKVKDTLPVGQLKWRKDDEQDTHYSLGLSPKKSSAVNKDKKEQQPPSTDKDEDIQDRNEDSGKEKKSGSKDAALPFAPNNESSYTGRQLSLEDTLTPINFKEYSIDPALERKEEEHGELLAEEKKPSFVAKPDLTASDTPVQRKREKPFASKRKSNVTGEKEWEDGEKQIPKWVRILWLPAVLIFVLFAGLIIGHSIIGEQPVGDIFDIDMWIHIFKLMNG